MKLVLSNLFLFAMLAGSINTFSQSNFSSAYKTGSKLYVNTESGLSLRDKPSSAGTVLTVVKLGEAVTVQPDASAKVPFTSTGIPGSWVKVKYQDKIGYQFDGFLSRFPPMTKYMSTSVDHPGDALLAYLKSQFQISMEMLPTPRDGQFYSAKHTADFVNGIHFEYNPDGPFYVEIKFPQKFFTQQEVFLLARMGWPLLFANQACPYSDTEIRCEAWLPVQLLIRPEGDVIALSCYTSD